MNISVIAVLTNPDPFDFEGRYIAESGKELTDTLVEEYKKRFNAVEDFAKWLLKYHWYLLSGCPFSGYMASTQIAVQQKFKRRIPIFIGEKAHNFVFNEDIEMVRPHHLGKYVDTLYLLDIPAEKMSIYKLSDTNWGAKESFDLKALKEEKNNSPLP